MKLSVKVITNSSRERIEEILDEELKVYLTCVPEKGKANQKLIKLLSKHFAVAKSDIKIITGEKSHNKIIEIQ